MQTKKKWLVTSLLGFPLGMAISQSISIIISLVSTYFSGKVQYLAVPPSLAQSFDGELWAVCWQTFWAGMLGALFMACRVIWDKEEWSLLKRSLLYYLITVSATLLVAHLNQWVVFHLVSYVVFLFIYTVIFMLIWVIMHLRIYFLMKRWNQKLSKL